MHIKSSETGVLRVFHIDLPREAIERFTTQAGTGEWPLQYALGAKSLRSAFVEVVNIRELGDMSLSQYLVNAHDVSDSDLNEMRARLDALTGTVLVLPSQAFNHTEQELTISSPLRWIGTFNEPRAASGRATIRSDAAKGVGSGAKASKPQKSGSMVWLVFGLLAVVALAIILGRLFLN